MVKNLPAMQETWVWSLGQEDPLEKGMDTDSSILAWRIPWTEKPGGLYSMGSQKVEHDWAIHFHIHKYIKLYIYYITFSSIYITEWLCCTEEINIANQIYSKKLIYLWPHRRACGILVPWSAWNLCPLQWKCGVLTTRQIKKKKKKRLSKEMPLMLHLGR